eukprot:TRINITY_DN12631_c0_g2_i2.p1 TRINITY_DN12631_c0_g2~~TRINITY_DN12631_c0_g2_i2.p1  ORF type:complete len:482 (-),score=67.67 TRINITY_DN12631_c0_g2_i2:148-1593(-)
MLKLLKLLRIFRLGRMVSKIQERFQIKHATIMIIQFVCLIMFAAHWLGCLYYYVSDETNAEHTWLTQYLSETGHPIGDRNTGEKYVASLYWALTTMSTIGYGDIVPISNAERILTTIAMVIGACTFAYGLTNVCTLLFNHNRRKVEFEGLTDEFNDFLTEYCVNESVCQEVFGYLWYCHHSSEISENPSTVDRLISYLSPELRDKVMTTIMEKMFRRNEAAYLRTVWSYFDPNFLVELSRSMVGQAHAPGEHVWGGRLSQIERKFQDLTQHRMFMITKGQCRGALATDEQFYELTSGSSFGEQSVLFGTSLVNLKVIAHGYVDVYTINEKSLLEILRLYPIVHSCLRALFKNRKHDFVQANELGEFQNRIATFLKEKSCALEVTRRIRNQPMSEQERLAALALVYPTSPGDPVEGTGLTSAQLEAELATLRGSMVSTQVRIQELEKLLAVDKRDIHNQPSGKESQDMAVPSEHDPDLQGQL